VGKLKLNTMYAMREQKDLEEELGDAIVEIQRKMIAAISWDGEDKSKLSVVKCLASGSKKHKFSY
jgi:hypothetical protein